MVYKQPLLGRFLRNVMCHAITSIWSIIDSLSSIMFKHLFSRSLRHMTRTDDVVNWPKHKASSSSDLCFYFFEWQNEIFVIHGYWIEVSFQFHFFQQSPAHSWSFQRNREAQETVLKRHRFCSLFSAYINSGPHCTVVFISSIIEYFCASSALLPPCFWIPKNLRSCVFSPPLLSPAFSLSNDRSIW